MPKIFVAYSSADLQFVKKLVDNLSDLGLDVLLDKKHFHGGRSTESEIRTKVQQSDYFIPVMTGDSARSKWVRPIETRYALDLQRKGHRIRIIPLLLRKSRIAFRELSHLNYVDFSSDETLGFGKLIQALPKVDYDELSYLREMLDAEPLQNRTMLGVLRRMVGRPRKSGRRPDWSSMTSEKFMREVGRVVKGEKALDSAYWLLIIYGVLKFKDIEKFWDKEDSYPNSVRYSKVAPRGVALMNDLSTHLIRTPGRRRGRSVRRR